MKLKMEDSDRGLTPQEQLIVTLHLADKAELTEIAAAATTVIDWLLKEGLDSLPVVDELIELTEQIEGTLPQK